MRILICLVALGLAGCNEDGPPIEPKSDGLPFGVSKFHDGNVTCYFSYVYGGKSISCVTSQDKTNG